MDQRCRKHSRVLDTPPTGRNNEWKAGPSLAGTIGIALYWIHRVRLRVWRYKAGIRAPRSIHPIHTYSRWCGGLLCNYKKRCPHTRLGITNFGDRDLTDTRPHHRFKNEGHLEYLKCGRQTCVLCEPSQHDTSSCPGAEAGCDECYITQSWVPRTPYNLLQAIREMPTVASGPHQLKRSLKNMEWISHLNWQGSEHWT